MDGTVELRQLANLFRIAAESSRNIAKLRPSDAAAIAEVADQADAMAARLEAIAATRNGVGNGAN